MKNSLESDGEICFLHFILRILFWWFATDNYFVISYSKKWKQKLLVDAGVPHYAEEVAYGRDEHARYHGVNYNIPSPEAELELIFHDSLNIP